MTAPYNPLDKLNLGRSVAEALLSRPAAPLSQTIGLAGAGVYALYYTGRFDPYSPIAEKNKNGLFEMPIYVGKAVPKGARKGGLTFDAAAGVALRSRLRQHARSISEPTNLDLDDFFFRSVVIDDIWIPLGENVLIEKFRPIWNVIIDGFGNNPVGSGRENQKRSSWDVLHPGRKRALKLADSAFTADQLITRLQEYFAGQPIPLIPTEDATDAGAADDEEDEAE